MRSTNYLSKLKKSHLQNENGASFVELIIAIALSVILTGVMLVALTSSKQICATVSADQDLQQTANVIMNKIIKGGSEPGGTFRLSEATSYTITSISELRFVGTDATERRYFLNNTGNQLLYRHPTAGGTQDETLYTAPTGTTLTLRFWPLAGSTYTNITIGIDVGLSRSVNGRTVTGSVTTMINIRNHPT